MTFKNSGGTTTKTVEYKYDVLNRWTRRTYDSDGPGSTAAVDAFFSGYDGINPTLQFDGAAATNLDHRYLWGPNVDQLMADEDVSSLTSAGNSLWAIADHLATIRDIADQDESTHATTIVNHRSYSAFGLLVSQTNSSFTIIFGYTGKPFDEVTKLQNNLNRWYDPILAQWTAEDPDGLTPDDNPRRYVHNSPLWLVDPDGLEETILAAEGRVSGKAIEESMEETGAKTQQGISRVKPDGKKTDGIVDVVTKSGKKVEIGPASPTGVPAKAAQAASAGNADVVLYKQKGKIPKAGSYVEYVKLPYKKLKELQAKAKANGWTRDQIWEAAKAMGKMGRAKVSPKAVEFAGRLYLRGKLILGTGSKCCMGVSPLDFIFDGIDYWQDPGGFWRKPAYLFPGMLVFPPADPYDPVHNFDSA